jgi:hypothetical protein
MKCPYCGTFGVMRSWLVLGKDGPEKRREIEPHLCSSFRTEPELATLPDFVVIPERTAEDAAYALARYRRGIR